MAQGDASMSTIGIGPTVGYAFGKKESKSNPYIAAGIQLYSLGSDGDTTSGTDISIGAGMIISIKEHFGLIIEVGYHFQNLKNEAWPESISGNIFGISIGIAGLLF
jgi:outer membrane protein W